MDRCARSTASPPPRPPVVVPLRTHEGTRHGEEFVNAMACRQGATARAGVRGTGHRLVPFHGPHLMPGGRAGGPQGVRSRTQPHLTLRRLGAGQRGHPCPVCSQRRGGGGASRVCEQAGAGPTLNLGRADSPARRFASAEPRPLPAPQGRLWRVPCPSQGSELRHPEGRRVRDHRPDSVSCPAIPGAQSSSHRVR